MRVPGFPRLYAGLLLGRVAGTVVTVALVLFVLTRYHSPQLAGATAFFAIFPGLLVSPLAGALLDRKGRARLVVLDYVIAAVSVGMIAGGVRRQDGCRHSRGGCRARCTADCLL